MTQPSDLPEVLKTNRQLGDGELFQFACHPGVPCFNTCCRDVNILLTPVDVLKLARRAGLHTKEFLDTHTLVPITKDLHLPVVILKMGAAPDKLCPFLGENGCTVYDERPWACRMYPLGMAMPPARAGVEPEPVYFIFEDDFCKGRGEAREWTVASWRGDQGVEAREELEAGFRDIVSHPWFIGGQRQLDPKRMEMYFTACYDLDGFRSFIFDTSFLQRFEIEAEHAERLRTDDEALLHFAFIWLRFALFGEPTMKVRPGAPSPRRKP
ncbi:MAG: YkgJ family cysteine cluster protein [Acidobacteriota bacterium]